MIPDIILIWMGGCILVFGFMELVTEGLGTPAKTMFGIGGGMITWCLIAIYHPLEVNTVKQFKIQESENEDGSIAQHIIDDKEFININELLERYADKDEFVVEKTEYNESYYFVDVSAINDTVEWRIVKKISD